MTDPTLLVKRVLLAGGGSGGHVFPALAVGEELRSRGWEIAATGSQHGIEARLYEARGVTFHPLPARPFVGRGPLARLGALATLCGSAFRAAGLVRRLDIAAVVATGGYAAAPAIVGGRLAGRPVLLVEPNAHAGTANRWLSPLASEAAVADAATAGELRCPATVTGVPVRAAFAAARRPLAPAPPYQLLVLGGSQGAATLNRILPPALVLAATTLGGPLVIVHQAGDRHRAAAEAAWDVALQYAATRGLTDIEVAVVPFVQDVAAAMANSHLVISRAGAITLAEIAAAGRPSLLLPLALANHHQESNARAFAAAGAALVVDPSTFPLPAASDPAAATAGEAPFADERLIALGKLVAELLADWPRLVAMADAAANLDRPAAAAAIADRVEVLAGANVGRSVPTAGEQR